VAAESCDEVEGVKAFGQHFVEEGERVNVVVMQEGVGEFKVVFVVEDVEVGNHLPVGDVIPAKGNGLVVEGQGISHRPVCFDSQHMQRFRLYLYLFVLGDLCEGTGHLCDANSVKVKNLTARQDGGQNFVFLGGGQDKEGVWGRLFQRLEKGVECGLREHVHLVDDIDAICANLRWNAHFFYKLPNIFYRIVGGGVQFVDAVGATFGEGAARFTHPARLHVGGGRKAVDGFGKDACASGFAHTSGAAKQVGVRQLFPQNGVLEGGGNIALPQNSIKTLWPVLPGRYNKMFHKRQS